MRAHSSMPSSPLAEHFPERLLAWWDQHGRKDLPWQHPRHPYRVWISEVMLQQTQVSTVVGYFERWMERFPEIRDLAESDVDNVLALWSGLGYYARARNIHKAARECVERFDGQMPRDFESLTSLPGIGPSTANAIRSLAFDQPAAILDGNVKRLLARHAGVEGWPGTSPVQRMLWKEAEKRLPEKRAADYSQAVMDMGALVCTRGNPACDLCPVSSDCAAFNTGRIGQIPGSKPAKKVPVRTIYLLIARDDDGRVLLERRPPTGIWGGLWSLPEGNSHDDAGERLGIGEIPGGDIDNLPEHEHRLTHLHMRLRPGQVTLARGRTLEYPSVEESSRLAWFRLEEISQLGLAKPISRILNQLETENAA